MIHKFSRYERKILLTQEQKLHIQSFLEKHMLYDMYSKDGIPYQIYNYYLDTNDYEIIRHSLSKPTYKHKIRMRYYDDSHADNKQVFLEIKSKMNRLVNKRRIELDLLEANKYLLNQEKPNLKDYISQQIFKEIDYLIHATQVSPKTYIQYERIAYEDPKSDLRITLDSNLLYQSIGQNNQLIGEKLELIPPEYYLMEIKSAQNFPLWLVNYLTSQSLFSHSFSKYGSAFQHYIQGGSIDDLTIYNKAY